MTSDRDIYWDAFLDSRDGDRSRRVSLICSVCEQRLSRDEPEMVRDNRRGSGHRADCWALTHWLEGLAAGVFEAPPTAPPPGPNPLTWGTSAATWDNPSITWSSLQLPSA